MDTQTRLAKNNRIDEIQTMDRRTLLVRAGAVAALGGVAMTSREVAAQDAVEKSWNANAPLVDAALDCVKESEACIAHCVSTFNEGSTMLAKCSELVLETIATCTALAKLGSYGSPQLKDMARICIASCRQCEQECKRHASHHEECKSCAASCNACIGECKKLLG